MQNENNMLPFQTTAEQAAELPEIVSAMIKVGIDDLVITEAAKLAEKDQGVFELMQLWLELPQIDPERDACLNDIKHSIEDSKKPVTLYTIDMLDFALDCFDDAEE